MKEHAEKSLRYFESAVEAIEHEYQKTRCIKHETISCDDSDSDWGFSNTVTKQECSCNFEEGKCDIALVLCVFFL